MADSEPSLVSVRELPESTELSNVELDQPTTDDTQQLLDNEDGQDGTEDNLEDSFIPDQWNIQSRLNQRRAKWWFLEPEVKENYRVVITAWVIVLLGLGCLVTGIVLEIINHHVEAIRGIIFFIVAIILLVPGLYAVVHIYLAAKRVGRITFSTIPFFRR
ncbi:transmembrane protein 134-like [Dysidea avara]|uniref:transmembrane protein 134-like n=1 Tax=Dysidea avara TaxID=196820 RepID=UPI0033231F2C